MTEWVLSLAGVALVAAAVTAGVTYRLVHARARRRAKEEADVQVPRTIKDLQKMHQETDAKLNEEGRRNEALDAEVRAQKARVEQLTRQMEDFKDLRQRVSKV